MSKLSKNQLIELITNASLSVKKEISIYNGGLTQSKIESFQIIFLGFKQLSKKKKKYQRVCDP